MNVALTLVAVAQVSAEHVMFHSDSRLPWEYDKLSRRLLRDHPISATPWNLAACRGMDLILTDEAYERQMFRNEPQVLLSPAGMPPLLAGLTTCVSCWVGHAETLVTKARCTASKLQFPLK